MAADLVLAPIALSLALAGPGVDLQLRPAGVTLTLTGADGCTLELAPGPELLLAGLTPTLHIDMRATEIPLELAPILRGPKGDPGESGTGGDKHYLHDQQIASDVWTVAHNLGKLPAIYVEDSTGEEIEGALIGWVDQNTVILTFSSAFGGRAILN